MLGLLGERYLLGLISTVHGQEIMINLPRGSNTHTARESLYCRDPVFDRPEAKPKVLISQTLYPGVRTQAQQQGLVSISGSIKKGAVSVCIDRLCKDILNVIDVKGSLKIITSLTTKGRGTSTPSVSTSTSI